MTRKDYIKLAKIINNNIVIEEDINNNLELSLHKGLIFELTKMLKEDNNNFDVNRFNNACFVGFENEIEY